MPTVSASRLDGIEFEGISLSAADFTDGKDEGEAISPGNLAEVAVAEIGEDGQLGSYDYLRLGDNLDSGNQDSAKGKLFVNLFDDTSEGGEQVDERTEFRFVTRPKNSNRRTPLTEFVKLRNANQSDPSKRLPFLPVSVDGKPAVIKSGRILAVEVRNPAVAVTIGRSNTDIDLPARAGY